VRDALGNLEKVKRVVKVFGMVDSAPGFGDQPKVIDGCSDSMTEVFGEAKGKGIRSAVGMAELPFRIPGNGSDANGRAGVPGRTRCRPVRRKIRQAGSRFFEKGLSKNRAVQTVTPFPGLQTHSRAVQFQPFRAGTRRFLFKTAAHGNEML
jgi:hypothetical protein